METRIEEQEGYAFYRNSFSPYQLKTLYSYDKLLSYYLWGMNMINLMNQMIDDKELCKKFNGNRGELMFERAIYKDRVGMVKQTIEKMGAVQLGTYNKYQAMVINLN
jgi:hypothetical protein